MDDVSHVVVVNALAYSLLNRSTFLFFFFVPLVCGYSGILVQDVLKREKCSMERERDIYIYIFFFNPGNICF